MILLQWRLIRKMLATLPHYKQNQRTEQRLWWFQTILTMTIQSFQPHYTKKKDLLLPAKHLIPPAYQLQTQGLIPMTVLLILQQNMGSTRSHLLVVVPSPSLLV